MQAMYFSIKFFRTSAFAIDRIPADPQPGQPARGLFEPEKRMAPEADIYRHGT